tara:strand:+ start:4556 stop:6103 length:1548 start_codon:yes stop_codon:yes gene_type:complete
MIKNKSVKKIKKVLVSVYNKSQIIPFIKILNENNIEIISTGGTKKILEENKIRVTSVESITQYPSILGGRVKTLHPKIFGGILNRSEIQADVDELKKHEISTIDMVIVDLYPFLETTKQTKDHDKIIEKIDIGGVSLIRASAKNYKEVLIIPSISSSTEILQKLINQNFFTSLEDRLFYAKKAFEITSQYEMDITKYFDKYNTDTNKLSKTFTHYISKSQKLRYGENPHQKGRYYGDLEKLFTQLNGKELSYNNLLDLDAAINLMEEFDETSFGILKHNNACGFATCENILSSWNKALAGDPISAFGGVLVTNSHVDIHVAKEINKLFFEILIAPSFCEESLELLKTKKNRIILKKKNINLGEVSFRSVLNGVLSQDKDHITDDENIETVTEINASKKQMEDLKFASKICKHTKSNAIVLVKNKQLIGLGCGQTSRVDALNQAILKAEKFGFILDGSVMASDAFFPFPDCVQIAQTKGVSAVIQPGGSKNDNLSIDYCNKNDMAMVFTGNRHFKH